MTNDNHFTDGIRKGDVVSIPYGGGEAGLNFVQGQSPSIQGVAQSLTRVCATLQWMHRSKACSPPGAPPALNMESALGSTGGGWALGWFLTFSMTFITSIPLLCTFQGELVNWHGALVRCGRSRPLKPSCSSSPQRGGTDHLP